MAKSKQGLTVERADLLAALTTVTKAVESRNTYPILANVYLAAADNRLTVRGSDLDIEITTGIPAKGALSPITAPAKTMLDIVRKLPPGAEVQIEPDGALLIVKAGRSRFKLATLSADSFPTIEQGDYAASFDLDLAGLFKPVAFAMSDEEVRYYLNGIFLHTTGGETRAVATDGHRLVRNTVPAVGDIPAVIVPRKTVGLVPDGLVHIDLSASKIRVTWGDTIMVSKLVEGTYPDYERVTPKNNDKTLSADRATLLAAIERVSVMTDPKAGRPVKLDFAAGAVVATVANHGDGESAVEEVAADYESEPVTMGFNVSYLGEMLRNVAGNKVEIVVADPNTAAVIRGSNDNWIGVQMPMRVA